MKKEISNSQDSWVPSTRKNSLFSPWFEDDFMEPHRWMNDFFNRDFPALAKRERFFSPAIDVDETETEYLLSADMPGIKKEDINIECVSNQLTISAERKYESSEGKKSDYQERFYGTYQRSFSLPTGVDAERIAASFENGVLTVYVPKAEQVKTKRIEIAD